jgi:hypothetical protein
VRRKKGGASGSFPLPMDTLERRIYWFWLKVRGESSTPGKVVGTLSKSGWHLSKSGWHLFTYGR